jgi:hypothetical protein
MFTDCGGMVKQQDSVSIEHKDKILLFTVTDTQNHDVQYYESVRVFVLRPGSGLFATSETGVSPIANHNSPICFFEKLYLATEPF